MSNIPLQNCERCNFKLESDGSVLVCLLSDCKHRKIGRPPLCHIQVDMGEHTPNSKRRMHCGIGPELPPGDTLVYEGESWRRVTCKGCLGIKDGSPDEPAPVEELGTPISQLSGRPGEPGYAEFCRIARSWGHD